MYSLNDKQIDFILNDISARGVRTEDLQYNLLDHVCCIIENELKENGNFEQFYNQTINRFYKKELAEIEDETQLLLTFKHYYTMKKIMMISGFFSATLLLAGAYFKVMHWPGASIMFTLGIAFFSTLFLPLMFTLRMREKTEKREKVVLGFGLFISVYLLVGALFKIMHWPGAGFFVLTGIPILLFIYMPVYLYNGLRDPDKKVNTIITSILIVAGVAFTMILPNRSNVYNVMAKHNYLRNEEQSLQSLKTLVREDSANKQLYASWLEFINSANELKKVIVRTAADIDYQTYVEGSPWQGTEVSNPYLVREMPETVSYINSLINFEKKANANLYVFEQEPDAEAKLSDRSAQMNQVLSSHPNVKDLLSTIINTQEQACIAMAR